jgi:hypothetical protein
MELIPPAYVLEFLNNLWWLRPSRNRVVVLARQATYAVGIDSLESIIDSLESIIDSLESILGLLKSLNLGLWRAGTITLFLLGS